MCLMLKASVHLFLSILYAMASSISSGFQTLWTRRIKLWDLLCRKHVKVPPPTSLTGLHPLNLNASLTLNGQKCVTYVLGATQTTKLWNRNYHIQLRFATKRGSSWIQSIMPYSRILHSLTHPSWDRQEAWALSILTPPWARTEGFSLQVSL